jgi:hypothetical protein
MFHPLNSLLMLWKFLICLFIGLELFNISIKLFLDVNWERQFYFLSYFETIVKFFLITDIFIVCNTGIFKSGAVIFKRMEVIKYYLGRKFIFDLVALVILFIPYFDDDDEGHNYPAFRSSSKNILKILFFFKLHQLSEVYEYLEEMLFFEEAYEGLLSLTKLFIQIIVISHLIACFWAYAALRERSNGTSSWLDKTFYDDPLKNVEIDWSRLYLYSWYWSLATMITVGYGDIAPRNDREVAVASVSMLFGCGFFAYAISSIGTIVERFSIKKKNFKYLFFLL